jgi:hypothetical protein
MKCRSLTRRREPGTEVKRERQDVDSPHVRTVWRVGVVIAALAAFAVLALHGQWGSAFFYGAIPLLFLLNLAGMTYRGLPVASWVLLIGLWTVTMIGLAAVVRELLVPDATGAAVFGLGVIALGGFAGILTVGAWRTVHAPNAAK